MSDASRVYEYLRDVVYLYLLAYYKGGKVVYNQLGEKIGLAAATVSQKVKKLVKDKIIELDCDGSISYISNFLNLDKEKVGWYLDKGYSPLTIGYLLLEEKEPGWSDEELCCGLGCAMKTLEAYRDEISEAQCLEKDGFVYGIVFENKIVYVGFTTDLEQRMYQHMARDSWLRKEGFVILEECQSQECKKRVDFYVHLFQPDWNLGK